MLLHPIVWFLIFAKAESGRIGKLSKQPTNVSRKLKRMHNSYCYLFRFIYRYKLLQLLFFRSDRKLKFKRYCFDIVTSNGLRSVETINRTWRPST